MTDQSQLQKHSDLVWNIANLLRGPYRPPQYRRVMIPLTVLRRLDCVLADNRSEVSQLYQNLIALKTDTATIERTINHKLKLKFHNTSKFSFDNLLDDDTQLATNLRAYMAGFSSRARAILEKFKFDEEIERLDEANRLYEIIKEFQNIDLHPSRIPNSDMGTIFEDLVRRFNEQANEEAGDHFTPREVVQLMVNLLFTGEEDIYQGRKVIRVYDPTCGTGGILSEAERTILRQNDKADVSLFGQEYNPESYAICGSDLMIKGEEADNVVFGDTLGTGRSKDGFTDGDGHPDKYFHYMAANPPFGVEWKPEKDFVSGEYETFGFKGRFGPGLPRINDGALLFLLHMIDKMEQPGPQHQPELAAWLKDQAKQQTSRSAEEQARQKYTESIPSQLRPIDDGRGARIAVIFNGSPLFTGDAGSGESNIRRWIIEHDMLEAIIGLPDQLFYNTGIYTYIWIVTNRKAPERKGKIQLINATDFAWKMKKSLGDKRKKLGTGSVGGTSSDNSNEPDHIRLITELYGNGLTANADHSEQRTLAQIRTNSDSPKDKRRDASQPIFVSKTFNNQDFGYFKITVERPLRLNFTVNDERIQRLQNSKWFADLASSKKRKDKKQIALEEALGKSLQQAILDALNQQKAEFANQAEPIKNRQAFIKILKPALALAGIKWDTILQKALLAPGILAERDPLADICTDNKNNPESDPELRDTENVPFPGGLLANGQRDNANSLINLPLPLAYENPKQDKGTVDKSALIELVRDHCQNYLAAEVLPYRTDAWIDFDKLKVGYEIPFNRHFYQYQPPRELDVIEAEIKDLEGQILAMLKEVV
ncbi:N-6 DNA methylase [Candidatus Thalassolituus haligoni]|uniref:type I restriction-modification system subunit M n=1 Tax=Candidatus Thalassolituus haligoni TaxID=3100113 RepID=UPI003511FE90